MVKFAIFMEQQVVIHLNKNHVFVMQVTLEITANSATRKKDLILHMRKKLTIPVAMESFVVFFFVFVTKLHIGKFLLCLGIKTHCPRMKKFGFYHKWGYTKTGISIKSLEEHALNITLTFATTKTSGLILWQGNDVSR